MEIYAGVLCAWRTYAVLTIMHELNAQLNTGGKNWQFPWPKWSQVWMKLLMNGEKKNYNEKLQFDRRCVKYWIDDSDSDSHNKSVEWHGGANAFAHWLKFQSFEKWANANLTQIDSN